MPTKQRVVTLTQRERKALEDFVSHGKKSARAITRARILLLLDEGRKEHELTEILGVSRGTVYNVRKKYQQKGQRLHSRSAPRRAPQWASDYAG